jgi:hypothetical protein
MIIHRLWRLHISPGTLMIPRWQGNRADPEENLAKTPVPV